MSDISSCPACYSTYLIKKGFKGDKQNWRCQDCGRKTIYPLHLDKQILEENVRLAKQKQGLQDRSIAERKAFREYARVENAILAYNKSLVKTLKEYQRPDSTIKHSSLKSSAVGLIQFSDVHFNELVNQSPSINNKYDFNVASARCRKYVLRATEYFKLFKVKNIVLAMTGDMINSDRRLSELLNMATNRSQATVIAVDIMSQVIEELNKNFNVSITCVSGNESRVKMIHETDEIIATDNYDWTIFNFLEHIFKNSKGIDFMRGAARENIVSCNGQNVLIMHGESIPKTGVERRVQQIIGKWNNKGVSIDFIIFGHLHSARVGDTYARSSSLVGANSYSDDNLQLISRASQNIHIFHADKSRDSIKIDLQDVTGIQEYPIDESLTVYNAKSAIKNKPITVVHQVVV
tara:strand:- start:540 stop:1757 length:1218 start_codon:yes stop_codon:yes gene_type:complete